MAEERHSSAQSTDTCRMLHPMRVSTRRVLVKDAIGSITCLTLGIETASEITDSDDWC